jgi:hypothetical protein
MTDRLLSGFLTPEELAAEFRLKITTLKAWRRKRSGPAFTTIGKKILYRRESVLAWVHARETPPPPVRGRRVGRRR